LHTRVARWHMKLLGVFDSKKDLVTREDLGRGKPQSR
jgi:hypothetical protein